jgi:ribose 5-phosphate isomerase A
VTFLREEEKRRAAIEATKLIKDGQVVGLGTGSTVFYMMEELGRLIKEEGLRVLGIPTSEATARVAEKLGIPLTSLENVSGVDIAIDGADQVDRRLNLIKGMGGALTREKVVESEANLFVVIVDSKKLSEKLGMGQVVPVEVIRFAAPVVAKRLTGLGGKPKLRTERFSGHPFITDNGNIIFDVDFGTIDKPKQLEKDIKRITGVVESGLFVEMADIVYVGCSDRVERLTR